MSHKEILREYVYETESWSRMLAFLREENVNFKNRLAEIVDTNADEETLLIAEKFLDEFLDQDRIIAYLLEELKEQNKRIENDQYQIELPINKVVKNQSKLRKEMKEEEKLFAIVKEGFLNYLNIRY